jgi:hypothetical protein
MAVRHCGIAACSMFLVLVYGVLTVLSWRDRRRVERKKAVKNER